jgi:putative ABC transport system permease protein
MSLFYTLKIAWQAMSANKVRTGLTVLGMVIGIMAVIIVFSAGEGIKSLIVGQIESFGTDIIETEVKVPSSKKGMAADQQSMSSLAQGLQITTLTLEDMKAVMKLPNVRNGYGGIMSQEQVSYGNQLRKAFVLGVNASFIDIDKSEIDYGRFFTESENRSLAKVAVLGSKMKEKLFGDSDPIGRFIKLRQKKFRVVGVMKERGAVMVMDFDDYIYVPVRTLQKRIMGIDHITYMVHQLYDIDQAEATAEEVRAILRQRHNITDETKDDFQVTTMTEMMSTLDTITSALTLLLLAIVIISLVVGGVGIMNIMYVIITERTAEIGLRKAMGARQVDILKQFLLEAILVSLIGAVIGVSFGVLASFLVAWGASSAGLDWRFAVPVKSFVVAILFSLVAGVLFGVWPARKAARLDPIEALRAE